MRLVHERSECDIIGARKGYLAHGKACLKCGLKSRSAIKLISIDVIIYIILQNVSKLFNNIILLLFL